MFLFISTCSLMAACNGIERVRGAGMKGATIFFSSDMQNVTWGGGGGWGEGGEIRRSFVSYGCSEPVVGSLTLVGATEL